MTLSCRNLHAQPFLDLLVILNDRLWLDTTLRAVAYRLTRRLTPTLVCKEQTVFTSIFETKGTVLGLLRLYVSLLSSSVEGEHRSIIQRLMMQSCSQGRHI